MVGKAIQLSGSEGSRVILSERTTPPVPVGVIRMLYGRLSAVTGSACSVTAPCELMVHSACATA
jgi:hypothetical protein